MNEFVNFDRLKVRRLEKAYKEALTKGQKTFMFEGQEYLTAYAKYLLMYLREVFGMEEDED